MFMLRTKQNATRVKNEKLNVGVQIKIFVSNNIITFPCVRQNPSVIVLYQLYTGKL